MSCLHHATRRVARSLAVGMAALCGALSAPATGQSDLLVAPTRLILDGRATGQIILSNIGPKEATYRVTAVLRRMEQEGNLEPVDPETANAMEKAALEMVRFAPRRVVLPPGQPQSIRISARPDAALPDGEYRIHLSFNGVPDAEPVAEQAAADTAQGLSIQLIPIYGITIPIIVRKGNIAATAAIANPRIEQREDGGSVFRLDMTRSGKASVFGEIIVLGQGRGEPLYRARGIAIYPEIEQRGLALPLSIEQAAALKSAGRLRIEYRELPENGGTLLAAAEGAIG